MMYPTDDELEAMAVRLSATPMPNKVSLQDQAIINNLIDAAEMLRACKGRKEHCTGCRDMNGDLIYEGDHVRYNLQGDSTKQQYWNPEYEVIWRAPEFTLKHIGGGKDSGSYDFKLRSGGDNGVLEIIKAGPRNHDAPDHSDWNAAIEAAAKVIDARKSILEVGTELSDRVRTLKKGSRHD